MIKCALFCFVYFFVCFSANLPSSIIRISVTVQLGRLTVIDCTALLLIKYIVKYVKQQEQLVKSAI